MCESTQKPAAESESLSGGVEVHVLKPVWVVG